MVKKENDERRPDERETASEEIREDFMEEGVHSAVAYGESSTY